MYTMVGPGKGFCPLRVVSQRFVLGVVLDKIDNCINRLSKLKVL